MSLADFLTKRVHQILDIVSNTGIANSYYICYGACYGGFGVSNCTLSGTTVGSGSFSIFLSCTTPGSPSYLTNAAGFVCSGVAGGQAFGGIPLNYIGGLAMMVQIGQSSGPVIYPYQFQLGITVYPGNITSM